MKPIQLRRVGLAIVAGLALLVAVPLAVFLGLSVMVSLGDREWSRNFGVSSGYEAAVEGALLAADAARPELIRRDFTTFSSASNQPAYQPCPLSAAELDAKLRDPSRADHLCTATAGFGVAEAVCPLSRCVQVVLNDQTLSDAATTAMLVRELRSRLDVCRYARTYGWNQPLNAGWLGCSGGSDLRMKVLLVGVDRVAQPCVTVPVKQRNGDMGSRNVCRPQVRRVLRAL